MLALKRIHLAEVDSTNNYIKQLPETNLVVTADYQTAGRGQSTNSWESENCANLLFSIKVSPTLLPVKDYFLVSMIGALALKKALDKRLSDITLKWPNDIYWRDRKLSGTLIETAISGKTLQHCILGIGVNVNQREFKSDAPNPVSIWQITGETTDRDVILDDFLSAFADYYGLLQSGGSAEISKAYNESLYRKNGIHRYEDAEGKFEASIEQVLDNGHLVLIDTDNRRREYEFKEVKFMIGDEGILARRLNV